ERICGNCGHPLSPAARFCPNCGAAVSAAEQPASETALIEAGEPEQVPWRAREAIGVFLVALIGTFIISIPLAILLSPVTRCSQYVGRERVLCQNNFNLLSALGVLIQEAATLGTVLIWVRMRRARPRALGFR